MAWRGVAWRGVAWRVPVRSIWAETGFSTGSEQGNNRLVLQQHGARRRSGGFGGHDSDLALINGIVDRDERAMAELYSRYSGLVWAKAFRVTQRREGADETTQEVFLTVWRAPGGFDASRGSIGAWLSVAAHHRSVDWLRHEVAVERRELAATNEPRFQPSVADGVAERETVLDALLLLPAADRDPIVLAHFGGLTYREVAVELGVPEGTTKSRIRSGLARLARLLEDHEDQVPSWSGRADPIRSHHHH